MRLIVDEKLIPTQTDPGRKVLTEVSQSASVEFECVDLPPAIGHIQHEVVALAGLGIAVATLVVALLQLARTPPPNRTEQRFFEASDRLLVSNGGSARQVQYDQEDVKNITDLNGRPVRLTIVGADGWRITLYIGATPNEIYVSSVETDWRALLSE